MRLVVSGTDTGVGKTIAAAMLMQALGATYFKPVQSGLEDETDTDAVRRLTGLPDDDFLPEIYRLRTPASPHVSAEIDGVTIDPARLAPPQTDRPLIVEGAGGLLVPLTRQTLFIDAFADWGLPVVLCARTALGGINHALLSIEALKARAIPIHGIVFVGDPVPDTERTIVDFSGVRRLGRLPWLDRLNSTTLAQAFAQQFRLADFRPGDDRS